MTADLVQIAGGPGRAAGPDTGANLLDLKLDLFGRFNLRVLLHVFRSSIRSFGSWR